MSTNEIPNETPNTETITPFVPEFMKPGYVYNPQTVIPNPQTGTATAAPATIETPAPAPAVADQKKPGEWYRGRDTNQHHAQFDNDHFRSVPPDELEKLRAEAGQRGRKRVYPFATMQVGDEWVIPHGSALESVRTAAVTYGKRHDREYLIRKLPNGRPAVVRLR